MLLPMRRRLHAAWCELRGETAWTVPAAGWDMVRDLDCSSAGRLSESRDSLARLLESGSGDISRLDASHMRRQLWWADAWLADDSPYGIHFLTPDERDKARLLLDRIDPACFPGVDGDSLSIHREAMTICEALACGGQVLLSSSMEAIDELLVNRWVGDHQHEFDLAADTVAHPVDSAFMDLMRDPDEDRAMLDAALGAHWPDDANARTQEILNACKHGLDGMAKPGSPLRKTAQHLLNVWMMEPRPERRLEAVRLNLPARTRAWEGGLHGRLRRSGGERRRRLSLLRRRRPFARPAPCGTVRAC